MQIREFERMWSSLTFVVCIEMLWRSPVVLIERGGVVRTSVSLWTDMEWFMRMTEPVPGKWILHQREVRDIVWWLLSPFDAKKWTKRSSTLLSWMSNTCCKNTK